MPGPLALGLAGVGLARSIFGGKKYKYKPQAPFVFNPNENDPGLALRRRRALADLSSSRANTLNEVNRAGLLGSGAGMGVQQAAETAGLDSLYGVDQEEFMRQRDEQLQQYNAIEAFNRQRALLGEQAGLEENRMGLDSLGDIGSFLGQDLYGGGLDQPMPFGNYLKKRFRGSGNRGLRSSLLEASDYTPQFQFR